MGHKVRDTSLHAYLAMEPSGTWQTQRKAVLDYIICHPQCTDKELSVQMGLNINCLNELEKDGLIFSPLKRVCGITGRLDYVWESV